MTTDVVELTRELCAIPSTTGAEAAVVDRVAALLEARGWPVKRQPLGQGRDNVLSCEDGARVLLTTHLDTVPPFFPPEDDGAWLVGRGVCDAKGIAAAMIVATERLRAAGETRVGLLFVVGEETSSDGAKAAADGFVPRVDYLIDGEPTDGRLCVGMKGTLVFDLEVTGKAGHSAYPELGHSAVHQLVGDLTRLLEAPWPDDAFFGATNLNVGTVEGGVAANVIAPAAQARCVLRTSVDAARLEEEVRGRLSEGTRLTVRSRSSPMELHRVEGEETCVVAFGSDVPHLAALGAPLLVGPGSIHDAHTAHERVRKADLEQAAATYVRLSQALLETARKG